MDIARKFIVMGQLKLIATFMPDIRKLFYTMVDEGVDYLKKCQLGKFIIRREGEACMEFFESMLNFKEAMREWGILSVLKGDQNSYAHPFTTSSRVEVLKFKESAMNFLKVTLQTKYCGNFPHISLLSLVSIKVETVVGPNKVNNMEKSFVTFSMEKLSKWTKQRTMNQFLLDSATR